MLSMGKATISMGHFREALDRGHTPAAYSLAVMHLNGIGCEGTGGDGGLVGFSQKNMGKSLAMKNWNVVIEAKCGKHRDLT